MQQPTVDPFILKIFEGRSSIVNCKAIPSDISWDEKQEQARVARERKRYVFNMLRNKVDVLVVMVLQMVLTCFRNVTVFAVQCAIG